MESVRINLIGLPHLFLLLKWVVDYLLPDHVGLPYVFVLAVHLVISHVTLVSPPSLWDFGLGFGSKETGLGTRA